MATDANLVLQAQVTKATTFSGGWLSLLGLSGAGGRALWAHVLYNTATSTSTNTATFSLDVSPDGGTTVYAAEFNAADQALALTTTAQAGEIAIPFSLLDKTLIAGATPAIRLTITVAGGGTASVVYSGYVELGFN
jgi:hypothetical protein